MNCNNFTVKATDKRFRGFAFAFIQVIQVISSESKKLKSSVYIVCKTEMRNKIPILPTFPKLTTDGPKKLQIWSRKGPKFAKKFPIAASLTECGRAEDLTWGVQAVLSTGGS